MSARPDSASLSERVRRIAVGTLQLTRTRLELAGVELQQELGWAAGLLVRAVLLLALALVALLLGCAAVLLWLKPEHRALAATGLALAIGLTAFVQWRHLQTALAQRRPLFEHTLATLAADQAALTGRPPTDSEHRG